ncbi:hypothetical protein D3C73_522680 [compost metagenome]
MAPPDIAVGHYGRLVVGGMPDHDPQRVWCAHGGKITQSRLAMCHRHRRDVDVDLLLVHRDLGDVGVHTCRRSGHGEFSDAIRVGGCRADGRLPCPVEQLDFHTRCRQLGQADHMAVQPQRLADHRDRRHDQTGNRRVVDEGNVGDHRGVLAGIGGHQDRVLDRRQAADQGLGDTVFIGSRAGRIGDKPLAGKRDRAVFTHIAVVIHEFHKNPELIFAAREEFIVRARARRTTGAETERGFFAIDDDFGRMKLNVQAVAGRHQHLTLPQRHFRLEVRHRQPVVVGNGPLLQQTQPVRAPRHRDVGQGLARQVPQLQPDLRDLTFDIGDQGIVDATDFGRHALADFTHFLGLFAQSGIGEALHDVLRRVAVGVLVAVGCQ